MLELTQLTLTAKQHERLEQVPVRYRKLLNRRNVPGWEGVNLALLARDVGVSGQYLRDVLCGRREGSVRLVDEVAQKLGWDFSVLVRWMERGGKQAQSVDRLRKGMRLRGVREKLAQY